jgi:3-oxoacyl-[acyl-carrier-protein] synthase-3
LKTINGIEITGIACCVPPNKISNKKNVDKKRLRTIKSVGIETRYIAEEKICTSDLVLKAANHVIQKLKWRRDDVDILILVTQTPDYLTPATSGILQDKLKLRKNIIVYDINLGCSGYTHGLIAISSIMKSLNLKKGLLAVGDVTSKLVNNKDNVSNLLFGDAGSVTAIENKTKSKEKMFFDYYSDGSGFKDIIVPSHSLAGRIKLNKKQLKIKEDSNKNIRSNINISLDGINIFNFAINYVPIIIKKLCKKIKVRYCFLHQANKMIQESIEKQLSKNKMTFPTSLHNFGNTSSATIPITICHNFFNQRLVGNSIFCGFGVGLSMSAVIINIQKTKIFKIIKI